MATETSYPSSPTEADLAGGMSSTDPAFDTGLSQRDTGTRSNDVMRRVVQGAHATIDRLAETAEPVVNRLTDSMSGAGGSLQQQADHLREVGSEWTDSMRNTVRENPLAAVGIAVAVGLLIARLTR